MEEIKTPAYQLYEKGKQYFDRNLFFPNYEKFKNFASGKQWERLETGGVFEPVTFDIIEPILNYKAGVVTANEYEPVIKSENFDASPEEKERLDKYCELLQMKISALFEKDKTHQKFKRMVKSSGIHGDSYLYFFYDKETEDLKTRFLSRTSVMFGDETEEDLQEQPYILFPIRVHIDKVKEKARNNGISEEQIAEIKPDVELKDENKENAEKCLMIIKLFKQGDTVWVEESIKNLVITKERDTKLSLYPLVKYLWYFKEETARGYGIVESLVPNQIEINKTLTRRGITIKQISFPQKVVNTSYVINPEAVNNIGAIIEYESQEGIAPNSIFSYTSPASLGQDANLLQQELITTTRELKGASNIATGDINPERASGRAILAVKQSSEQPINEQIDNMKSTIEDCVYIILDHYRVYSSKARSLHDAEEVVGEDGQMKTIYKKYNLTKSILKKLKETIRIDVTPTSPFDKFAIEMSLENLLTSQQITFEEYVDSLPYDSVMPKSTLKSIIEKRREVKQKIAELEQVMAQQEGEVKNALNTLEDINEMEQQVDNDYGNFMNNIPTEESGDV